VLIHTSQEISTCEIAGDKDERADLSRKRMMGYTSARGGIHLKEKRRRHNESKNNSRNGKYGWDIPS
jgi:hypothetical protein